MNVGQSAGQGLVIQKFRSQCYTNCPPGSFFWATFRCEMTFKASITHSNCVVVDEGVDDNVDDDVDDTEDNNDDDHDDHENDQAVLIWIPDSD